MKLQIVILREDAPPLVTYGQFLMDHVKQAHQVIEKGGPLVTEIVEYQDDPNNSLACMVETLCLVRHGRNVAVFCDREAFNAIQDIPGLLIHTINKFGYTFYFLPFLLKDK